jgi:hypothetical protein
MQNWQETLLSQYVSSPTLVALIEALNDAIDPATDLQKFYDNIWNVQTAVGYGLDVWGRIVGVDRVLQVSAQNIYFGFNEAFLHSSTQGSQPFNQQPFYSGPENTTSYALGDNDYRTLILAKAATNISDCSIPSINAILRYLFGSFGNAYVENTGAKTMNYRLNFTPTNVQIAIFQNTNVIPRPAGVKATLVWP